MKQKKQKKQKKRNKEILAQINRNIDKAKEGDRLKIFCDDVAKGLKENHEKNVCSEHMEFDYFTTEGREVYKKLLRELHARANKTNLTEKIP